MTLTIDIIDKLRPFRKEVLSSLGLVLPLKKGWMTDLIGKEAPDNILEIAKLASIKNRQTTIHPHKKLNPKPLTLKQAAKQRKHFFTSPEEKAKDTLNYKIKGRISLKQYFLLVDRGYDGEKIKKWTAFRASQEIAKLIGDTRPDLLEHN